MSLVATLGAPARAGLRRSERRDPTLVGAAVLVGPWARIGCAALVALSLLPGAARALIPRLRQHVPLRRLATEAEVSAAIVFLLSPAAAFVTGVTLRIDGGAPLGNAVFPSVDHDRSRPFEGFHRAVVPKVLQP